MAARLSAGTNDAAVGARRRSRAGRAVDRVGKAAWAIALAATVTACAGATAPGPAAVAPSVPASLSPAASATRAALAAALAAHGLGLIDTSTPVRPAEPPTFADVPLWAFLVPLGGDPMAGLIVVYELPTLEGAVAAGQAMAVYLGSGPGRVQRPSDVQVVLRQVGSTLVLFSYAADGADPTVETIASALAGVGTGVTIPGG